MQVISYSNAENNDSAFEDMLVKVRKNYDENVTDECDDDGNDYPDADELEKRLRVRFGNNIPKKSILDSIFQGKDRITFTLPDKYKNNDPKQCDWYFSIIMILRDNGYSMVDYIKGICEKDGRQYKIGKVLKRHNVSDTVINGFANSEIRNASKTNLVLTLSRNKIDVIGMSTNKGWTSCMNLSYGTMNYHLDHDVTNETLIAYFHKKEDENIENPTARFLLKRYFYFHDSKTYYLYQTEESTYGSHPYDVLKVGRFLEEFINFSLEKPDHDPCVYNICHGLYNDSMPDNLVYLKNGWDFYNKEHVELFNPAEYKGNIGELKTQLKNHKNKNMLLHNRYLYSYVDFVFDDEVLKYIVDNNISIRHILYDIFYGEKIDIDTLKLFNKYEDLSKESNLLLLSNIYGGFLTIEDGILKDESHVNIFNLRKQSGKKYFLTSEEYELIDKIRHLTPSTSSIVLSKVYTFINTDENYAKMTLYSLSNNDLINLRKYLTKEEIIKFIDKSNVVAYRLRKYQKEFVMEYKPELFEEATVTGF